MARKKGSQNLSQERCNAIFDAHMMGVAIGEVEIYFKMPHSTVSNVVKRIGIRRSGIILLPQGRPKKLKQDA